VTSLPLPRQGGRTARVHLLKLETRSVYAFFDGEGCTTIRLLWVQVTSRTRSFEQVWGQSSERRIFEMNWRWTRRVAGFWICGSEPCGCAGTLNDFTNIALRVVDGVLSIGKCYRPFDGSHWPHSGSATPSWLLDPEDEGTKTCRNVGKCILADMA
jgi:hypothetical protein